jgi:outer membrane protein insertion porin family
VVLFRAHYRAEERFELEEYLELTYDDHFLNGEVIMIQRFRCKRIILLILVLISTQLFAQAVPYDNQIIEKIDVLIATDSLSKGESLRSRLKTKEGNHFSQTDFDTDLKLLVQDYDRVEPQVESENGKIHITLKVWSKPTIRNVIWQGNGQLTEKQLQKELGIAKGTVFDRQGFNTAFHKVKAFYVKKGFFEAELEYNVTIDSETNQVDITVCIQEGRAGMINQICFIGLSPDEESELSEIIATRQYNFFLSWFTESGTYKEDMIQHDKFQVLNFLQNKGFADAIVEFEVEESCEGRIALTIRAEKGPLYTFGAISIDGNCIFTKEQIEERLTISEGDAFSTEEVHESIRSIMSYYGRYGYIEAVVNYEPKRLRNDNVYAINFTISEGEQYRVGMIKVLGNCITQTKVILHESLIIPGEVFNSEKLKITELRLQNIGYFKNVNVYAVRTEDNCSSPTTYRDVHIEVEETSTGNIGAFLGFSTSENIFGGVNLTEKNFNIMGFSCLGREGFKALRGAGEYAHITATIGQKSRSYVLSWTKPYFMDTAWSVGFNLENSQNEYISKNYDIRSTSLTLHAAYPLNAFVKIGTHYRIRYSTIDINEDDLEADQEDEAERQEKNSGLLSAIGYSWLYDSTNNPMCPTNGLKSKIEAEFAGLGGKFKFLALGYTNTYYFPLFWDATLKLRGNVRFIEPLLGTNSNQIPLDERFFMGGENELRGYRPYRLGPKLEGDDDDPLGGISMQLVSAEVARPIFSRMEGFVFLDGGHISDHRFHFGFMNYSLGFGARIKIFEGGPPLTVGMGFPINPRDSSDVKRFFLNIGGKF